VRSTAITIKQISSISGYSISTVSKALNDKLEISKATRKTIKTIAKQHNYIPNNYAVSLRMQKTGSIAVILPEVTKECYSHSLCSIQKSAEQLGYRILFYQTFNSKIKELRYIKSLNDGSIDGIIFISSENKSRTQLTSNLVPIEFVKVNFSQTIETIKENSHRSLMQLLKH
jgi:LacI family transcriptional regulator